MNSSPSKIPTDWDDTGDAVLWSLRNKADVPQLPEYLTELYEESCKKIPCGKEKIKFAETLLANKNAFAQNKTDVGTCSIITHKIDTGGAVPIRQPLRRTPQGFEMEEEKYLKEQWHYKTFKICMGVSAKKMEQSVGCIDYRKLNDCTRKDAYPLPCIDMCLDCLAGASIFSKMDLQSGYWQIVLEEKDREKSAFITKYGLFEYTKMPFGLCSAPSTFQRCMELIFRGMQWKHLLIYLDDIIIFSQDMEDHFKQLNEVLQRLHSAGLKLKPTKCELLQSEVLYLGHVVGKEGIKPNPKITKSIKKWKTPQNVKQVQQFLGLCNYYSQFIHKFSDISAPLSSLTQKDKKFVWSALLSWLTLHQLKPLFLTQMRRMTE